MYGSYLIDSYAWNTICRKIEDSGKSITNSSSWGNYYNNTTTNYENINTLYAVHAYDNSKVLASTYSKKNIPTSIIPRGNGNNRLELSTGSSQDFKAFNVYDLAGNMWEYTTEIGTYSSSEYVSLRGGSFYWPGTDKAVTCVASDSTDLTDESVGFRAVLYLK